MARREAAAPFAAAQRRIDRRIAAYTRLAAAGGWSPLDNATAEAEADVVAVALLAALERPPRAPEDRRCRGYYAAIARGSPPTCGSLATLLSGLALAALFPAVPPPAVAARLRALPLTLARERTPERAPATGQIPATRAK